MVKIFIDPGHGGTDSGANGNGLLEKNVTLNIAKRVRDMLTNEYSNATVKMSRTGDQTVSLTKRTNDANSWGADYFLSIHINAGGGTGYEDYIHNTLSDSSRTAKLRNTIHQEIIKLNNLQNRGKKKANFHVLRESHMPALLTENGFIDTKADADKMKSNTWLNNVARGHVNGLAKALGLKKKQETGIFYRVITGSFSKKANAEERKRALETHGFESFIETYTSSGTTYYRVITGSFKSLDNAEERVAKLKAKGFDSFIVVQRT